MIKPVFDISLPDVSSVNWPACHMLVELNRQYINYVVLDANKAFVALRFYHFSTKNGSETIAQFGEIFREDKLLMEHIEDVTLLYNLPEASFVPGQYFDKALDRSLLDMMHGDLHTDLSFSEPVNGLDIYTVFRVPAEMHNFLQRHFPTGKYRHFYSPWLECMPAVTGNSGQVTVLFYRDAIIVSVFRDSRLHLLQSFDYQTAEDVAYHLLNIYQRLALSQQETRMLVSGMIDTNSAMYQELYKYFLLIEADVLPVQFAASENLAAFPAHFFSPLLKLAVCEL